MLKKIVDFDILLEESMQKTLLNIDETKASKKKADVFNLMTKINDEKNGLLTIDDLCELHAKEEIAKKFESRKKMRLNLNQKVDEVLTSAILDVFDFDMSWLNTEIKKVDWSIELTNPLQDYDFLKKKVDGFVIF
jgi:hypothetical protein